MAVDISQFHQIFFEEVADHLAAMEQLLVDIDIAAPDAEDLNAIFRAAHSIKGGAGTFGFTEMAGLTHALESPLDRLRKDSIRLDTAMVDLFLEARDALVMLLDRYRSGAVPGARENTACAALGARLDALCAMNDGAATDQGCGFFAENSSHDDSFGFFDEPPPAAADASFGLFVEPVAALRPAPPEPVANPVNGSPPAAVAATAESSSIRVSIGKTDQLINLVGELVITEAMLEQMGRELDPLQSEQFQQALAQLSRNTRQLQEAAMSLRMLPVGQVFSRFPRLVRDLAAKLEKQVELVLEGEDTELDKSVIEKLADPLTHIVRNSVDHGIETPAERIAAGKDGRGCITLRACHRGGNIVIEIIDDGRGLNRARILAKAQERGLPVHADMSDAEVWQLIFEPGFSTAEVITDVSGRGVGMDVVRRNIHALSGRVEIESWANQGSRITIRLPLTLAILDGMLVNVGDETFVVPLSSIIESLQPAADSVATVTGRGRVVRVRGEYIPLAALHELFNLPARRRNPCDAIVVLLESDGRTFAVQVDALAGQSQVVIKSLETNYRRVPGFSGATILGNGRVAMILDVEGLLRMSQQVPRTLAHGDPVHEYAAGSSLADTRIPDLRAG